GAHGSRRPDPLGNVLVARRRARRDLAQRLPHSLLERGAAHVEREIEAECRPLHETDHLRHHALELLVPAHDPSVGKTVLNDTPHARPPPLHPLPPPHERRGGKPVLMAAARPPRTPPEPDRADTPLGRCDEDGAQRAFPDGEPNRRAATAGPEVRRSHPEHLP